MNIAMASQASKAYQGLINMPGYQVYEYQLVLSVPDVLKEKIRKIRKQFTEEFQLHASGASPVILPLVKFRQRQLLEERMRMSVQQQVMGWKPFTVNLKDFGSQPTHSIFIPVTSKQAFNVCEKDLKSIQSILRPDKEHAPYFPTEHRIIIAARMPQQIYEKAWAQFSNRHFTGQFQADACLLLKRAIGNLPWQIAQRFELKNLPVVAKQASLFE